MTISKCLFKNYILDFTIQLNDNNNNNPWKKLNALRA